MAKPKVPKTGRPKKTEKDRKDEVIRVRVTTDQKAMLTAAAERAGYDVSTWLRGLGVREAQRAHNEAPEADP